MAQGSEGRTPEWLLERIALGELPPEQLEQARARLLSEPDGAPRLERLSSDDHAILESHPPAQVASEVQRRLEREGPSRPKRWLRWVELSVLPLVAAAAIVLTVHHPAPLPGDGAERLKGDPAMLMVHRQRPDGRVEQLSDGAIAQDGDLLQLTLSPRADVYAAVVSIDGNGTVTRHLPEDGDRSAKLAAGALRALPHAYRLDDAPRFERFVLVYSATAFELRPVLEAAALVAGRPDQPLALPEGLSQRSLTVRKVSP